MEEEAEEERIELQRGEGGRADFSQENASPQRHKGGRLDSSSTGIQVLACSLAGSVIGCRFGTRYK